MSKSIKQLAVIYTAAIVSGGFAFTYISHGIDALSVQPVSHTASTVVTANLQGNVFDTYKLQPANVIVQGSNVQVQPQVGGNGNDDELQPALGYGALNWVIQ